MSEIFTIREPGRIVTDAAAAMSLREYYAGCALPAMAAKVHTPSIAATCAVEYADALIEALRAAPSPAQPEEGK